LHNIFVPLIFLLFAWLSVKLKNKQLGKHHLKIHIIFLMIALGSFIHLILDSVLAGVIFPFYPFNDFSIGLNLYSLLPEKIQDIFFPILDACLLVLWLVYIEVKHKISDFI